MSITRLFKNVLGVAALALFAAAPSMAGQDLANYGAAAGRRIGRATRVAARDSERGAVRSIRFVAHAGRRTPKAVEEGSVEGAKDGARAVETVAKAGERVTVHYPAVAVRRLAHTVEKIA